MSQINQAQEFWEFIQKHLGKIAAALGAFVTLLGSIIYLQSKFELAVIVMVLLILAIGAFGAFYVWNARRYGAFPIYPKKFRDSFLAVYIITLLITILAASFETPVNCYWQRAFSGENKPLCMIKKAVDGEILVLVATFDTSSDMPDSEIIADILETDLEDRVAGSFSIRVEYITNVVKNEDTAQSISKQTNATIVIWGYVYNSGMRTGYTISTPWEDQVEIINRTNFEGMPNLEEDVGSRFFEGTDQNYVAKFTVGQIFYMAQEYDAAKIFFEEARDLMRDETNEQKLNLEFAAVLYYLAYIYEKDSTNQASLELALNTYSQSLSIDTDWRNACRAYFNRGRLYYLLGDYTHAMDDYNEAIRLNPQTCALAYLGRGLLYIQAADYSQALNEYNEAITHGYEYPLVYFSRGYAYYYQAEYELFTLSDYNSADANYQNAYADFNHALELSPDYIDALIGRGVAAWGLGDYTMAIDDFNQVIELDSHKLVAYLDKGLVFSDMGNYQNAIDSFTAGIDLIPRTEAIDLSPVNGELYLNRGLAYTKIDNLVAASADYLQWARLNANETVVAGLMTAPFSSSIEMHAGLVYEVQFEAQAGDSLTATASSVTQYEVDPIVIVLEPNGTAIMVSDDISDVNYDSQISNYVLPSTGVYTLILSHGGGGNTGVSSLEFEIHSSAAAPEATAQP